MLRIAAEEDVSAMLAIYRPYVLTSTATFEYDPPSEEEFLRRYHDITAQFPWLLWEEDGQILGYAYASLPFTRAAYAGAPNPPSISNLRHGAKASEKRCTTRWKRSSTPRGIAFFIPSSAGKTRTPCASTRNAATAPSLISRPAASSLAGGLTSTGWKSG